MKNALHSTYYRRLPLTLKPLASRALADVEVKLRKAIRARNRRIGSTLGRLTVILETRYVRLFACCRFIVAAVKVVSVLKKDDSY